MDLATSRPSRDLSRRGALRLLGAGALAAPAVLERRYRLFPWSSQEYPDRVVALVRESTVVDLLNQFRFPDFAQDPPLITRWLEDAAAFGDEEFAEYRDSGFDVIALGHGADDFESGLRWHARWNGFIASHAHRFFRVDTADDFERAGSDDRIGLMLTFQNSQHFRSLDDVELFHGLGQRISQITYNFQNRLGSGFMEEGSGGLSVFGAQVIARMNQVGMAVDLSHCNDQTTLDGIVASSAPPIFTHAACRALVPGALRLKTDEAIQALAAVGGVMGIPFLRFMIRDSEPVELTHVLDHVDHVARLVGIEHVAVGSDMDLIGNPNPVNGPNDPLAPDAEHPPNWDRYMIHTDPEGRITIRGLDHPKRSYDLALGLVERGYSDPDIRGVLGGNAVRVLTEIWEGVEA